MTKYRVNLSRTVEWECNKIVDAEDESEAHDKALAAAKDLHISGWDPLVYDEPTVNKITEMKDG